MFQKYYERRKAVPSVFVVVSVSVSVSVSVVCVQVHFVNREQQHDDQIRRFERARGNCARSRPISVCGRPPLASLSLSLAVALALALMAY